MYSVLDLDKFVVCFSCTSLEIACSLSVLEHSADNELMIGNFLDPSDWVRYSNAQLLSFYRSVNNGANPVNVTRTQLIEQLIDKIVVKGARTVNKVQLDCQCEYASKERVRAGQNLCFAFVPGAYAPKLV